MPAITETFWYKIMIILLHMELVIIELTTELKDDIFLNPRMSSNELNIRVSNTVWRLDWIKPTYWYCITTYNQYISEILIIDTIRKKYEAIYHNSANTNHV